MRRDDEVPAAAPDATSVLHLGDLAAVLDDPRTEVATTDLARNLPPGAKMLVVKNGPNAPAQFLLDAPSTVAGRHADSDILLDDATVSRKHVEFARHGGRIVARDLGSLNGTYLNKERIDTATLASGDEVQIGKFRLVYVASEQPGTEPEPPASVPGPPPVTRREPGPSGPIGRFFARLFGRR
ncbi:phosphopeptide-binding protein [Actinocatenispora sera]|uniref:Phosphopeptide-binding protein n=1 Tax=Actinocatenispora sera TaxID=390989 RepID=A0A810L536_9ACTN|nr:phosphopeptide-binding protein [Actinocatenispora sera]